MNEEFKKTYEAIMSGRAFIDMSGAHEPRGNAATMRITDEGFVVGVCHVNKFTFVPELQRKTLRAVRGGRPFDTEFVRKLKRRKRWKK